MQKSVEVVEIKSPSKGTLALILVTKYFNHEESVCQSDIILILGCPCSFTVDRLCMIVAS